MLLLQMSNKVRERGAEQDLVAVLLDVADAASEIAAARPLHLDHARAQVGMAALELGEARVNQIATRAGRF